MNQPTRTTERTTAASGAGAPGLHRALARGLEADGTWTDGGMGFLDRGQDGAERGKSEAL